jgi:glycosyltransferase 2 family protein
MRKWLSKNQQLLLRLAGSLLAVGALIWMIEREGWNEIGAAIQQIPISTFVIAAAFMFLSRLFVVGRWYVLLRAADIRISFWQVTVLTFTGLFSNNFLPTTIGGDVVRLAAIMSMGYDRAICLASLAADRLIGMAGMMLTLPFGLIPLFNAGAAGTVQSVSLAGLWKKGWDFVVRTFRALSIYFKKPFSLLLSLGCTLGNMAGIFGAIYFLILGLNEHMSFWLVAGLWGVTYFVTLVPISINGYGVQELSVSYLFSAIGGISMHHSLTLAVLIRAAFIVTSLPGALSLPSAMSYIKSARTDEEAK